MSITPRRLRERGNTVRERYTRLPGSYPDFPPCAQDPDLGAVTEAPATEVRDLYLSRNESAKYWQSYTDFAYYRLEVSGVYFIGGFGVMGWIAAEDYRSALPDPLAEAAPGIMRQMDTDHSDALLLIAPSLSARPPTRLP